MLIPLMVLAMLAVVGAGVAVVVNVHGPVVSQAAEGVIAEQSAAPANPVRQTVGPAEELAAIAAGDASVVLDLTDAWVAQLASAPAAQNSGAYLNAHNAAHEAYGAVLLSSDTFVFMRRGYWVSVVPIPFVSAPEALAWCTENGLPKAGCYAKLLTHDATVNTTTAYR